MPSVSDEFFQRKRPSLGAIFTPAPGLGLFPLSISQSQRYLVGNDGSPFLIHGDTPWALITELNAAQRETYLTDRASKGFNTILIEVNRYFSNQTPNYNTVAGDPPWDTTSYSASTFQTLNANYWATMDSLVSRCAELGILVILSHSYLGFGGGGGTSGDQGWDANVRAATGGNLQSYGAAIATRYASQGNIIWCVGGDYSGATSIAAQWNISVGIKSVNANAIICGHGARTEEGYAQWNGQANFGTTKWLNTIYTDGVEYTYAATAYARATYPFFLIEGYYDGETATAADCRRQAYATILSGGCGHLFGNNPIWGFGEPNANGGGGAASSLGSLSTTATTQMAYVKQLFAAFEWWKLAPSTGTGLVTTSLGSGTSRICPALASDGTLAMVWQPASGASTVNMAAMTGVSSVRARFYDTTAGSYSNVSGQPFAPSGTQSITWPGERVLVLDQA